MKNMMRRTHQPKREAKKKKKTIGVDKVVQISTTLESKTTLLPIAKDPIEPTRIKPNVISTPVIVVDEDDDLANRLYYQWHIFFVRRSLKNIIG